MARRTALLLILFCSGLSVLWGSFLAHSSSGGLADFKAVFYGARCLIHHADPYNNTEFLRIYQADGVPIPTDPMMADLFRRAVLVCINLPTTLFFLVPFALLPLKVAYPLWALLMAAGLCLACYLMWDLAAKNAPRLALFLVCFLAANCVILFADGNAACVVISLCVIAAWCFLRNRFAAAGVVCLALSLLIKPHDAGLVWIYFLLAGGVYRKRALQTLLVTAALGVPAVLWVTQGAPQWLSELRSNLQLASMRGGLNDPGPASLGFHHPDPILALQAFVSVFRDDPHFYVPAAMLVAGGLLIMWTVITLRARVTPHRAWLALAAIAALTMLVTYHRQHDAKLLLLTVPACALLWAEGGLKGWLAALASTAGIVITGDIPSTGLSILTAHVEAGDGFFTNLRAALLVRPAPLILLGMAVFYLWAYWQRAASETKSLA
jgi:hypothetical protein